MTVPLRVLLVEDSPDDAELIVARLVEEGFQPDWQQVQTEPEYLAALESNPDLILADWRLPHFSGRRALLLVRERGLDIPFVIVSGSIGEEAAIDAVHQGANDYVLKDRPARLGQAIRHALEEKRLLDEQIHAEMELRNSQQKYERIASTVPGILYDYVIYPDGKDEFLYISPQCREILEIDNNALLNDVSLFWNMFLPDDEKRIREVNISANKKKVFELEAQITTPSGEVKWISITSKPNPAPPGKPVVWTGFILDITIRKQAEYALAEERSLMLALSENIPDAIYFKDRDGRFLLVNEAQVRRFGLSDTSQAVGKTDFDFFTEEHARMAYEHEQSIIHSEQPLVSKDEKETWPDGRVGWVSTTKMPLRNEKGEIIGTFGISRDITERRKAEEKIQAALDEKVVLLREVHHRVKNNLQAIIYLIDLQAGQIESEGTHQFLRELQEQARTMSLVYEQLSQSENLAQVAVQPYIHEIVEGVREAFNVNPNIQLKLQIAPIFMDVSHAMPCGLIVNELITNAIKYAFPPSYSKKPVLRISLQEEGDQYTLTVSDNGVGLPPGYNYQDARSLGLRLVNLWATHQLGGSMKVSTEKGTSYQIVFHRK